MPHFRIGAIPHDQVEAMAAAFARAKPFPHIVIPDAIQTAPEDVLPHFPPADSPLWRRLDEGYQRGKMTLSNIDHIPEPLATMTRELMDPIALEFFERVSGIDGLLPDPYLQGGGLHCSTTGGVMAPHTDSHINHRLGIYKRVNVLVYLNPEWSEADGGCFELYDEKNPHTAARSVVPRWGTMVVFRSDAHSVHGFSKPIVGPARVRRTLALYYYTAADAADFAGYQLTHWRHHDPYWANDGGSLLLRRARLRVYRTLRLGSKALAYLAHRTGPRMPPLP